MRATNWLQFSFLSASLLWGLLGCQRYDIRINDNVIYSPPSLYSEFSLADPNLHSCMKATIEENKSTSINEIRKLSCSNNEISSLTGLAQFTAITHLDLRDNKVKDLEELNALVNLQYLNLSGNDIENSAGLKRLKALTYLDLRDNAKLDCTSARALTSPGLVLYLPERCGKV